VVKSREKIGGTNKHNKKINEFKFQMEEISNISKDLHKMKIDSTFQASNLLKFY
jgi:hypothetical protein